MEDPLLPAAMFWNIFNGKTNDGMIPAPGKKIYFLSDFHLGAPNAAQSLSRERKVVDFLRSIEEDEYAAIAERYGVRFDEDEEESDEEEI